MSRKRAIEEAMDRLRSMGDKMLLGDVRDELEAMHSEGRLSGLREAARMAEKGNAPCSVNMRPDTYAYQKAHARALAKKARSK